MRKKIISPIEKTERIRREKDPLPWRYCLLTLICGFLLVIGFFWAARQHFSAMDLGIRNAKLRQQKESLEAEARRLYLSKEILLSPAEIKKAAKKIGLQNITAENFALISVSKNSEKLLENELKQTALKNTDRERNNLSRKIEKTAFVEKVEEKKSEAKTKEGKSKVQPLAVVIGRTQIARK